MTEIPWHPRILRHAEKIASAARGVNGRFPDEFSRLRNAAFHYLNDSNLTEVFSTSSELGQMNWATRLCLLEYAWSKELQTGGEVDLSAHLDSFTRAAELRGLNRSRMKAPLEVLMNQMCINHTLDSLGRDAFLTSLYPKIPANFIDKLRERFESVVGSPVRMACVINTAGRHLIALLNETEVERLLISNMNYEKMFIALVRYIGITQLDGMTDLLHYILRNSKGASLAKRFALVDTLFMLGERSSVAILKEFSDGLDRAIEGDRIVFLKQYAASAASALARKYEEPAKPEGLVIAQFMFIGKIGQAGKGDSGGLGVFLGALGDALVQQSGIARVYTLVLVNAELSREETIFTVQRGEKHTVLHIPICCVNEIHQKEMIEHEEDIRHGIERVLAIHKISPDIFHIRYSDHASRAAMRVAKKMGKKIVFTLTPDPHRSMDTFFQQEKLSEKLLNEFDFALERVYIADQILENADGFAVMPGEGTLDVLNAYFPQFESKENALKPKRVLPEGIQILSQDLEAQERKTLLDNLCACSDSPGMPRFDKENLNRPIIFNAGRLHPIKQQHFLVRAWAQSELWKDYNLVLVGGNLNNPSSIEKDMVEAIDLVFRQYPEAQGRFCHLPAMENNQLRKLELAICQEFPSNAPHVYACCSYKEEFGIALLEAMDAGMLAIGPLHGGVGSYIQSGENGFLVDTHQVEEMQRALSHILRQTEGEQLFAITKRGQMTVRENYDIASAARRFSELYRQIAS